MKRLTKAEEQVMQVLWDLEQAFVREVVDALPDPKPAYNTISTIVRILEEKGVVAHTAIGKTHRYYPLISKEEYSKFYLESFLTGYFGGSFQRLVSFFARENNMSITEFEQMLKIVQRDLKKEADDE